MLDARLWGQIDRIAECLLPGPMRDNRVVHLDTDYQAKTTSNKPNHGKLTGANGLTWHDGNSPGWANAVRLYEDGPRRC